MPVLDSDLLITFLRKLPVKAPEETRKRKRRAIQVIESLTDALTRGEKLLTTIFNVGELYVGANRDPNKDTAIQKLQEFFTEFEILPFTLEDSFLFGKIKAQLLNEGNICGDFDITISSIVINHNEVLYTANVDHFQAIKDLTYKNWTQ